jgi:hypothetical protein
MNREQYFSYIEEKLNILATRIISRGKLNILDFHIHSENFYRDLLNKLYGWSLVNENTNIQNIESVDLIDQTNALVIQVSATNTKQKIESSLSKDSIKQLKDKNYTFKFIFIANNADNLRVNTFKNPHKIKFTPKEDVIDISSILTTIKDLEIDLLREMYELVKKELGSNPDPQKLETNLATVINILSKANFDNTKNSFEVDSFEIDRKIDFNRLNTSKEIISDWKIYIGMVDRIYTELDTYGYNKSSSVLNSIKQEYVKVKCNNLIDDRLFLEIIERIINKVESSTNYMIIPRDELEQCVNVLVVDAFIRCKIFDNPKNYHYATTR